MRLLISIIIPVYNNTSYLYQLLSTLDKQYTGSRSQDVEILLIDDGSDQEFQCDLLKFQELYSHIKVFNKKNGGLSDARNFGLEKSKGKYSVFLDPDDQIPESYLHTLLSACLSGSDIYMFDFHVCNANGNCNYSRQGPYLNNITYIQKLLTGQFHASVCTKLIRTSLYQDYSLRYETGLSISEDLLLIVNLLLKDPKVQYVDKIIYQYNVDNSILTKLRDSRFFSNQIELYYRLADLNGSNHFAKQLLRRKIDLRANMKRYKICRNKIPLTKHDLTNLMRFFDLKYILKAIYSSV